jgi:hypothetical protein
MAEPPDGMNPMQGHGPIYATPVPAVVDVADIQGGRRVVTCFV